LPGGVLIFFPFFVHLVSAGISSAGILLVYRIGSSVLGRGRALSDAALRNKEGTNGNGQSHHGQMIFHGSKFYFKYDIPKALLYFGEYWWLRYNF
jgi:hypothetical protein